MLKERDKKLLFYSWSYGILAAAFIYACCGYGALAYTELADYTITGDSSSYQTVPGNVLWVKNITAIDLDGVSYVTFDSDTVRYTQDLTGTLSGSTSTGLIKIGTTAIGNGSCSWTFHNAAQHSTYTEPVEFTWIINDLDKKAYTGSQSLKFEACDSWAEIGGDGNGYIYFMATSSAPSNNDAVALYGGSKYYGAVYHVYSGSALPDAPVINDFTKDATCYSPGEAIVLESNVTGIVDSWLWEIYDSDDEQVWSSSDSVETIVDENFDVGLYQVQLYVENTGGNDFLSKEDWLNITQAGTCTPINNWTNPFPTQVTTIPTQQFYETMTMPPHIVTNMTGINEEINKGIFANMSQGYRDYIDYVAEQANTTFTGTFRTLLSPVSLIVNSISGAIGLFSIAINSLTVYTTVPLAITAIVINYMPWQIVTLITAGIAIDAILIIILGR